MKSESFEGELEKVEGICECLEDDSKECRDASLETLRTLTAAVDAATGKPKSRRVHLWGEYAPKPFADGFVGRLVKIDKTDKQETLLCALELFDGDVLAKHASRIEQFLKGARDGAGEKRGRHTHTRRTRAVRHINRGPPPETPNGSPLSSLPNLVRLCRW